MYHLSVKLTGTRSGSSNIWPDLGPNPLERLPLSVDYNKSLADPLELETPNEYFGEQRRRRLKKCLQTTTGDPSICILYKKLS